MFFGAYGKGGNMSGYFKEDAAWFIKETEDGLADEKNSSDYSKEYPYLVELVDQFNGHCEDGYSSIRRYKTFEEAVAVAKRITEAGLLIAGSIEDWHGMGDAGLIYHDRALVWSGVKEYTAKGGSDEVLKALNYAIKAHDGQLRKGTKIPYVFHPIGVANILMARDCINQLVIAALLHDIIEDTKIAFEDLRRDFGLYVAEIVRGLSEPDRSLSWKERKTHTIQYLKEAAPDVCLVSCADKLDNIRSIRRDMSPFDDNLWTRFNAKKEEQEWYYRSLAKVFNDREECGILKEMALEFGRVVEQVFVKKNMS